MDLDKTLQACDLGLFTDSLANPRLGFGGLMMCKGQWFWGQWEPGYIAANRNEPSIEYLELFTVTVALYIWSDCFINRRLVIQCDNMAVVAMLNKTSSSCKRCMHLIHLIILRGLSFNFRCFAVHVRTEQMILRIV